MQIIHTLKSMAKHTIVRIIWDVRISKGQNIGTTLYSSCVHSFALYIRHNNIQDKFGQSEGIVQENVTPFKANCRPYVLKVSDYLGQSLVLCYMTLLSYKAFLFLNVGLHIPPHFDS